VFAGAAGSTPIPDGAISEPRAPESCPLGARGDGSVNGPARAPGAWWRLDPVLDRSGALAGQALAAGAGDGREFRLELPPESFAAGPTAGSLLIGADDGLSSRLSILELDDGCIRTIATERAVVRRAVADPVDAAILEFWVDRLTRAELGVWRRPLDAVGTAERVLGPIDPDPRFGVTWVTDLSWADDGRLAVTSCGAAACRTRLLAADGSVTTIAEPDLGEPLGFSGGELLSYLACRGLPCPIVAVDLDGGGQREIVTAAGIGSLMAAGRRGPAAIIHRPLDRAAHEAPGVEIVPLDGSPARRVSVDAALAPVGTPARTGSGIELEPGWIALDAGGRIGSLQTALLLASTEARPMPAPEVLR
jgi:hypothetical protein